MESINPENLKHPEFRYVEVAFGGIQKRNVVCEMSEIVLPAKPVDCFRSIFRFGSEFKEYVTRTGSVKGFRPTVCYADHLWFDVDNKDLNRARETTDELLFHLESQYNLLPDTLLVYFSGQKGFHVGMPAECFGWEPSRDLPKMVRNVAIKLAEGRAIDQRIYDTTRLLRLSAAVHSRSGLYKIRLDPQRFREGMSTQEILDLARRNEQFIPDTKSVPELSAHLNEVYIAARQEAFDRKARPRAGARKQESSLKPCIRALLQGVSQGLRSDAAIRLAAHFSNSGMSKEGALTELLDWNNSNQPPLAEHEIKRTVESAYSDNAQYDYGCNDPILSSVCDKKCKSKRKTQGKEKDDSIRTSFMALPDGSLVEMLYCPERKPKTFFVRYNDGQKEYVDRVVHPVTGQIILPFEASRIIENRTVLFPSEAAEFGSKEKLLGQIRNHISRYLLVSPFYVKLASYYVLFSWVYDNYNVLPYLRALGGWGTGKSRFLQTIGYVCYKPTVTSGAATVSPIFRLLDKYRGTLVIDEADFPQSDDAALIIKVLNCGFQRGCPILRCGSKQNNFEPESFDPFGPKVIGSRHEFKDKALESRCLTEVMDGRFVPGTVPTGIPDAFFDEALSLRNKLLMFRLTHYGKTTIDASISKLCIEPRLAQVLEPLAGIIENEDERASLMNFAEERNQRIIEEKMESTEGRVASAISELWQDESNTEITMKMIAGKVNEKHPTIEKYQLTPKKVGSIVRDKFRLSTTKRRPGFCLNLDRVNGERFEVVARGYGIEFDPCRCAPSSPRSPHVVGQGVTP